MRCFIICLVFLYLAPAVVRGTGRVPGLDTDWEDFIEEKEISLAPNDCTVFEFDSKKSEYKITVDVSDFSGCDPSDIQLTPVHYEGECFKREAGISTTSVRLGCQKPGKFGVESKEDICSNFDDLKPKAFAPDESDGDTQDIIGSICFEESTYYLAMKSSCENTAKVKISVDKRSLSKLDDAACLKLSSFREGEKSFWHKITHEYLWVLILVIIFVVVILPTAITLCICFCACCQCCKCCIGIAKTPCKCAKCTLKPVKKVLCCCC